MRRWKALLWILGTATAMGVAAFAATGGAPLRADAWLPLASPGALSRAHASLGKQCAACHEPYAGVTSSGCIACHAGAETLLAREATAFHGRIGSCRECHVEHAGADRRPTAMDHSALAVIGLRDVERGQPQDARLRTWLKDVETAGPARSGAPLLTPMEALLDCAACHSTKDRHQGQFGSDCARCHATASWRVPGYRHPAPTSTDCAQCHRAPPSHYMGHFHMVSVRIAKQPHARVEQCHLCHLTTAWNDIRGVGWYKHH